MSSSNILTLPINGKKKNKYVMVWPSLLNTSELVGEAIEAENAQYKTTCLWIFQFLLLRYFFFLFLPHCPHNAISILHIKNSWQFSILNWTIYKETFHCKKNKIKQTYTISHDLPSTLSNSFLRSRKIYLLENRILWSRKTRFCFVLFWVTKKEKQNQAE